MKGKVWKGKLVGRDVLWLFEWMGYERYVWPKWVTDGGVYEIVFRPVRRKPAPRSRSAAR